MVGLGTWQLGADWGDVEEKDALAVLDAAVGAGVTLLDTADVYGDGRSEQLIGQFLAAHPGLELMVATKMGRRVDQDPALYTLANFRAWTDRSRANLGMDTARPGPAALPADPGVLDGRGVRRAGHAGRRAAHRRVRRQRRDL